MFNINGGPVLGIIETPNLNQQRPVNGIKPQLIADPYLYLLVATRHPFFSFTGQEFADRQRPDGGVSSTTDKAGHGPNSREKKNVTIRGGVNRQITAQTMRWLSLGRKGYPFCSAHISIFLRRRTKLPEVD